MEYVILKRKVLRHFLLRRSADKILNNECVANGMSGKEEVGVAMDTQRATALAVS